MLSFKRFMVEGMMKSKSSAIKLLDRVAKIKGFKGKEYASARTPGPVIKTRNADSILSHAYLSRVFRESRKRGDATIEHVELKDLHTMQGVATVSVIKRKIMRDGHGEQGPVDVVQDNSGRQHLMNGNHRVMAARLRGHKTIEARVHRDFPETKNN